MVVAIVARSLFGNCILAMVAVHLLSVAIERLQELLKSISQEILGNSLEATIS